ncbi:MAG: hypothetical protein JNN20_02530 [Betaproteobacteria bacterium]|nr:hypothetical protein [Betaproteobacteria bacterium]
MTKKAALKTNYVLIDFENRPVKSIAQLAPEHFRVHIFLGKNNTKVGKDLAMQVQAMGARAKYVNVEFDGKNVLDFYIAYYLGELSAADPTGFFHIISGDKGFDPLVAHIKERKILSERSESIEEMRCFREPVPAPAPVPIPAAAKVKAAAVGSAVDEQMESLIAIVIEDLIARGDSRPVRMKTLVSTIHARIGKDHSQKQAEAVRDELVKRKIIVMNGAVKFTYKLPKAK